MIRIRVTASAVVPTAPEKSYGVLADYRRGHPRILPKPPFIDLDVERGGVGAGTIIRFQMRNFGRVQEFRAEVTEPEPGRVLVETDLAGGAVTTFTVSESTGGLSLVTITTEWASPAPRGWVERLLAPPFLRRVYAEELVNLGRIAATWPEGRPPER